MSNIARIVHNAPALPPRPARTLSQTSNPPAYQESWHLMAPSTMTPHDGSDTLVAPPTNEVYHNIVDDRLSQILSLIDQDIYHGTEADLVIDLPSPKPDVVITTRSIGLDIKPHNNSKSTARNQNRSINILAKIHFYSNSRLPTNLPPLKVYIPTWPLLCLAAQYSSSAYQQQNETLATYVPADPRLGTKATVVNAVCCDDRKTIVFAIRGTSTFSLQDWNVNLSHKPTSPAGFLDDEGNLCHSGFLRVARAMVKPIATHLRTLLEQNPSRAACSLLITGHSAGGAVASLIYTHMLSRTIESDLTILTACFKRVHCVTFGAPPISLLPLSKPPNSEARLQKCLFHSFINEGDPVVRAEPVFVRSLIDLLTTPLPSQSVSAPTGNLKTLGNVCANLSRLDLNFLPGTRPKKSQKSPPAPTATSHNLPSAKPNWRLPPSTLSNAGRLVVLRTPTFLHRHHHHHSFPPQRQQDQISHEFRTVTASVVSDEQIRQVVFGDPLMHGMEVYRRRIEALSFRAVTAKD